MGCPVPKVVGNGEGSALMKKPELIEKIVRALFEVSDRPVTVKIRPAQAVSFAFVVYPEASVRESKTRLEIAGRFLSVAITKGRPTILVAPSWVY
jgi:hypothetical protein